MSRIPTKFFGECDCEAGALFSFPSGLPGFEDQRTFFFLKIPGAEPLLFLQSVSTRNLCFILLPILAIDPDYDLDLAPEELFELQLPPGRQPAIGRDILCAATISSGDGEAPRANLMAPIVVNLQAKIGMQVIHGESGYSHRHPLRFEEAPLPC
ncbi:MAG: flagellar assembly protein FliW [Bryobacteraceae bacterium]|jgi:flagellar assembly factor FliW